MSYKSLLNKIDELRLLVGDWRGQQPSQLEMDMALDRVKKIYELLRFSSLEEEQVAEPQPEEEPQQPIESDYKEEEFVMESISVVVEPEPETEPEPEVEPKPEKEEECEDEEDLILDIDILKSANKERYNKILSLYCDLESQEPIAVPEPEAEPEPTPAPTPEPISIPQPKVDTPISTYVASNNTELYKISSQLGINDRFLLANDLFGGDISALSESLTKLDEFTNIDDVMIYIAENYKWDGDSEGAKLLYTLLQNRFF